MKRFLGSLAIFALLGLAALSPGNAGAENGSSMLVRAFICPQDYAGSDWALDCDPLADVEASVYIDASEYGFTDATDANGEAYFEIDGGGPFVIELGVPGDFAEFFSLCGEVGATEPSAVQGANTNRLILDVQPGKAYYCSFYVSPVDARGEVSDPQTPEDIEVMPDTGSGVTSEHKGLATVGLLLAAAVMVAGLGMLTAREELLEQR